MAGPPNLPGVLAAEIAADFDLGDVRAEPSVAAIGWGGHNIVWRFETASGLWAVKEIGREPGLQIEAAAEIEAAAHLAGVPAPRPVLSQRGRWLVTIDGRAFRCHEWVTGTCPTASLTSEEARAAGTSLAHLHSLRLCYDDSLQTGPHAWGEAHWRDLADVAASLRLGWARRLADSVDAILEKEGAAKEYAATSCSARRVASHCDVRPDNTMRTAAGLVLVDWDAAGPVIPGREVSQALRWWSPFERDFIDGYRSVEGDVDLDEGAGEDGGMLWWLELNVRLAIERPEDVDRQQATTWLVEAVPYGRY